MKINYKFNKSSEALTCKVESVELEFESSRELIDSSLYLDILNEYAIQVVGEDAYLLESDEDIEDYISDFDTVIEEETTRGGYELQYIEEPLFDGYFVCFNKIVYTDSMEIQDIKIYKIVNSTKTFTNQQDLKDYINLIKEPIEFIGSSSIDDVLLKDWLGEWEIDNKILNSFTIIQLAPTIKAVHHSTASVIELFKETRDNPYGELEKHSFWLNYKEFDDLFTNQVKIGSPKLNSNWKFKIK